MGLKLHGSKCFSDMPQSDFDMNIIYIECGEEYSICISEHGIVYAFGICNYSDFDVNKESSNSIQKTGHIGNNMLPKIVSVISQAI